MIQIGYMNSKPKRFKLTTDSISNS